VSKLWCNFCKKNVTPKIVQNSTAIDSATIGIDLILLMLSGRFSYAYDVLNTLNHDKVLNVTCPYCGNTFTNRSVERHDSGYYKHPYYLRGLKASEKYKEEPMEYTRELIDDIIKGRMNYEIDFKNDSFKRIFISGLLEGLFKIMEEKHLQEKTDAERNKEEEQRKMLEKNPYKLRL